MYVVKFNSFSKWKEGAWASGTAIEIGLAVVDMQSCRGWPQYYHGAFKSLHVDFANYHLAKFEQLGYLFRGWATKKVILTFLQDVDCRDHIEICPNFFPPESPVYTKPHGYIELEFQVYNTELQMEFYLWLVCKFCHLGGPSSLSLGEAR